MSGCELFLQQIDDALVHFPGLKREVTEAKTFLKGEIHIIDREGKHWESYLIEIHPLELFPKRFPVVYETGGKIEPISDWHINADGSCCIKVLPEEILSCLQGITLTSFLQQEVLPYFFNQTHRKVEGYYVNGEYSHGLVGIYESYAKLLRVDADVKKVILHIILIIKGIKPGRTHICFCGSGKKFRRCHREIFDTVSSIGKDILKEHARIIAVAAQLQNLLPLIEEV